MPLKGIVPDPVLGAIDPVLRTFIEMGYDRTDYSAPTRAKLFPSISLPTAATEVQKAVAPAEATSTPSPTAKALQAASTPKASTPKASASKVGAPKKAASASNDGHKKSTGGSARPSKASD